MLCSKKQTIHMMRMVHSCPKMRGYPQMKRIQALLHLGCRLIILDDLRYREGSRTVSLPGYTFGRSALQCHVSLLTRLPTIWWCHGGSNQQLFYPCFERTYMWFDSSAICAMHVLRQRQLLSPMTGFLPGSMSPMTGFSNLKIWSRKSIKKRTAA